jgi:hypothetical protein
MPKLYDGFEIEFIVMLRTKSARLFLAILAAAVGALVVGNIEVELPPDYQGVHQTEGQIVACDFEGLGRYSDKFFLGVTLDAAEAPYLRANPLIREKQNYVDLCSRKARARVYYTAKERVFGPIRFWIEKIEII